MVGARVLKTLVIITALVLPAGVSAQTLNSDANSFWKSADSSGVDSLIMEAQMGFIENRPIDARAKLQEAIRIAPDDYRPFLMLGQYYLAEESAFRLAYRYIKTSEQLFAKKYGTDEEIGSKQDIWRQHANVLYLLSEAELNLDRYDDSIKTLDRYGKRYWDTWYPGSRAWVLMKLKRIDEAIQVAQLGLLRGADESRTYNILGILLSAKDQRKESLEAFSRAIKSELAGGDGSHAGTPLNNAGEVYREMFQDDLAEAAWVRVSQLPDACEHILPSLNLSILLADELRFTAANQSLVDFQLCFAKRTQAKSDTEHRALLALQGGRIALRSGDVDLAYASTLEALEREQWFGRIGTNENDTRFAATISMAEVLRSKVETLRDQASRSIGESVKNRAAIPWLLARAWWLDRRAREIGIDELSSLEDIDVRHTDAMLEYPTLGRMMTGFGLSAIETRLQRYLKTDDRETAHAYYKLYLGTVLRAQGYTSRAIEVLKDALKGLRTVDALANAETLAQLELASRDARPWWSRLSPFSSCGPEKVSSIYRREQIYDGIPSHIRFSGLRLPVTVSEPSNEGDTSIARSIQRHLLGTRFEGIGSECSKLTPIRFNIVVSAIRKNDRVELQIQLQDRSPKAGAPTRGLNFVKEIDDTRAARADAMNEFLSKAFKHTEDPPAQPLRNLDIGDGLL